MEQQRASQPRAETLIRDPIVILAAPRSGSSLMLAALSSHPDLWSLYKESNPIFEGPLHPEVLGVDSNALSRDDIDWQVRELLIEALFAKVGNLERLPFAHLVPLRGRGRHWYSRTIALLTRPLKHPPIRIVEKSPRNTLRIPFLRSLLPDARFLHLTRDAPSNIASLCGGWLDPEHHNAYPLPAGFQLRGYRGRYWCFLLQPGWRSLNGASLVEVCADQWRSCNEHALRDLADLPPDRTMRIRFEDFVQSPSSSLAEIAVWAHLDPAPFARFSAGLPIIQRSTKLRAADRNIRQQIEAMLRNLGDLREELGYR